MKRSALPYKTCRRSANLANSQQLFQLVHMAKAPNWSFSAETSVGLPGAHGSELVRSFRFFDQEQVVFTAGEDGQIIAWRPT